MKSLIKKITAGVIAAVAAFGMAGLGASTAAAADDGSLTVSTNDASFAGKDVKAYRMFDASVGTDGTASYTFDADANGDWAAFFGNKDVSGLSEAYTTAVDAAKAVGALSDSSTPTIDAFAKNASNWAQSKKSDTDPAVSNATVIGTQTLPADATDGKYSVTFSNLKYGYYLVAVPGVGNTNDAGKYATLTPVLNGNGTSANIKGTLPTVDKKVEVGNTGADDVADANIGDELTFTLTSTIPDMSAYTTYAFNFKDTPSAGLTFGSVTSVVVKDGSNNGAGTTLTEGADQDYTVTTPANNNGTLLVTMNDFKNKQQANAGKQIVVTYTATINENAVVGGAGNTNSATVEYSNNPLTDGKGESIPDIVHVYTYQFGIDKFTVKNGSTDHTQLPDAEFQLKVKGATAPIQFVRTNDGDAEGATNTTSVYRVAKTADETGATATIVTPKSGRVDLTGLAKGDYVLTETKAPEGYNLPAHPFAVNVDGTKPTNGTSATTTIKYTNNADDENATVTEATNGIIGIENTSGPTLPNTGGMGTALFTVFGVLIIALGAGWYVRSRRRA